MRPGFRLDIQGLRGVAVCGVVLYHAHKSWVPGGIIGIDVFFAMSGYLIGSILLRQFEGGVFNIGQFYRNRVRRLFPALIVMLVGVLLIGCFILPPDRLRELGRTSFSTALFMSNFDLLHLMKTTGADPVNIPLVHTWSLAVEEHFYIFFPLLLGWALKRGGRRLAIWTISAATIVSFLLSLYFTTHDQKVAYLLAPTRAFELLIGALFALGAVPAIRTQRTRNVVSLAGLALILLSYIFMSNEDWVPGYAVLPPLIGTALFIHAGRDGPSLGGRWFSIPQIQILGAASYSIYLWHWPLICFVLGMTNLNPPPWMMISAVILSFVLGILSYRFVEQPFMKMPDKGVFKYGAISAIACAAFAISFYLSDGYPSRAALASASDAAVANAAN